MEARLRDLELELDEEKRRHAETIKILRKKERTVKEVLIQCEEDQKNVILLQDTLEKANVKINLYKRQLTEQVNTIRLTLKIDILLIDNYFRIISFVGGILCTISYTRTSFPT